MKKIFFIVLLTLAISGCKDSSNPVNNNPVNPSYKPIFPQPGYNSRNTSNPYCISVPMNPVQGGISDWSYTFQGTYFSDGSEFCVDSKGNIYYVCQSIFDIGGLYKFDQNGNVIWKIDSMMQDNFCGISLSADESRIYVNAYRGIGYDSLFCIDSAGKKVWSVYSFSRNKPLIGKAGTIYTFINGFLTAVSPNGNIIWQNTSTSSFNGKYQIAIDRDDNLYFGNLTYNKVSTFMKIDKDGGIIWQYPTGYNVYGVVIDGYGNVYFNSAGNNCILVCLNQIGGFKWFKQNINPYSSLAITRDNKILVSSGEYIIGYDTSGKDVWKSAQISGGSIENIILDDFDNVYYLMDYNNTIKAGSVSNTGMIRWIYSSDMYSTLPAPVLIPSGKLLFAPKRAYKIQAIK